MQMMKLAIAIMNALKLFFDRFIPAPKHIYSDRRGTLLIREDAFSYMSTDMYSDGMVEVGRISRFPKNSVVIRRGLAFNSGAGSTNGMARR